MRGLSAVRSLMLLSRNARWCANALPAYWQGLMSPSITEPVMAATVDTRLRKSLELVAGAGAS